MRKIACFLFVLFVANPFLLTGQTNDFYDDAETLPLAMTSLRVEGEVANPGPVDFTSLPTRSVIVKETRFGGSTGTFVGAYRYDGYSLYDILNAVQLKKKNETDFPPIIDLFVEIVNDKGEKVVFSWGEIYYPIHRHEILIAASVARIVPSKTKDLWPLPTDCRVVVAADLYTERNISRPVRITVRSYPGTFVVQKGLEPNFSGQFSIEAAGKVLTRIGSLSPTWTKLEYPSVFYGRGRGIHGTTPFQGVMLKSALISYFPPDKDKLARSFFVIAGKDGYRGVYSYSELFNRNDQAEFLLITPAEGEDGGAFKVYPAADFFSDRAIKAIERIIFEAGD